MPKTLEYSCPRHEVDEDDPQWSEALSIMADQLKPGKMRTFTPCPWCLDELQNDVREAHNTLDTVGIPRFARGKAVLSLQERLLLLFDNEEPIAHLRTS